MQRGDARLGIGGDVCGVSDRKIPVEHNRNRLMENRSRTQSQYETHDAKR